ncbi:MULTISPECIES: hypothetical protein [Sphingobium]|uniref:hypothetical protein n=1 Tax=Sphingobium TaxID=165695 RepID=UPI001BEC7056|nr:MULTISPECIES: hypothetical protein [Sphingobium]MBT2245044.1 hypothetical protein [Sphingobium sp. BHU LFT2]WBQ19402.1 hypothetical protein PAE53_23790 [Sphingobium yanoikuyae]
MLDQHPRTIFSGATPAGACWRAGCLLTLSSCSPEAQGENGLAPLSSNQQQAINEASDDGATNTMVDPGGPSASGNGRQP